MATFSYEIVGSASLPVLKYRIADLDNLWMHYSRGGLIAQPFISGCAVNDIPPNAYHSVTIGGQQRVYPSENLTAAGPSARAFENWMYLYSFSTGAILDITVYPFCDYEGKVYGVTAAGSVPAGQSVPGIYINPSASARPNFFYWATYGSEPPNSTSILWIPKATAWNGLRYNIAQLLTYKGLISSADSFYDSALPVVSSGTPITAAMYNQAVYYINYMHGGTYLSFVTAGATPMYAHYWYQLQYYINGIG